MKTTLTIIIIFGLTLNSYCQQLTFVKDNIMDDYMKSGYADKHFRPKGKEDKNKLRQGQWEDYEVVNDFEYVSLNGKPKQIFGHFLLYGEGKFVDGKREGSWKFYVVEDKTFNKILQQEVAFVKGEKTGLYKYFFPKGNIGVEGNYLSNKLEGEVKSYYEDGKLYGTRFYINGFKTGRHTYLYPNGKLELEHSFVNDTLDGLYQTFYPNGNKQESFNYLKGKEDGIYKYYYENGQLWIEKEYKNGLLMNVNGSYDNQGNQRDVGTIMDSNGTVNYYTEDGKIYTVQTFKEGKKISEVNIPNNQIRLEDLNVDTTLTGFHFAADFQGTYVYMPNGKSDLNTVNPSAFSFTIMPNATYQEARKQIEFMWKMGKQDGYENNDVIEKDTTVNGNKAYYTLFIQTLKGSDYRNIVFYAFYIKDGIGLLFISGDLDNGKYIENIKKTFYSTKF